MKKILFAAGCLFAGALAVHADVIQKLIVNGEKVEQTVTTLSFDGDTVVLHFTDNTQQAIDMESVVITFDMDNANSIYSLKGFVSEQLHISGLQPDSKIDVYNAAGRQVMTTIASQAETVLSTASLPQGVYVLRAGRQVVKFIKR